MLQKERVSFSRSKIAGRLAIIIGLIALAAAAVLGSGRNLGRDALAAVGLKATGQPQLVSVQPLPEPAEGDICALPPANSQDKLVAALQEKPVVRAASAAAADTKGGGAVDRPPLRVIRDPYPSFSAVVVDSRNNEIILQDENLFQIMAYDRTASTPPSAAMTEPKRVIGGPATKVEFNCGLYVDPDTGDIYSVNNDTLDTMTVFSRSAKGNVPPSRELRTPHRTFGIAVDEKAQELFLTVQHPPAVVVYPKMAKGNDAPLRIMEGDNTRLEDPHGIALDTRNNLMYVTNHGSVSYSRGGKNFTRYPAEGGGWKIPSEVARRENMIPGSGLLKPPSITVYSLKATGDAAPIRTIEGPATQLDWPAQIYFDEEHGELYVANDVGDAILVFKGDATGNATPVRIIKGPKSGIKNPTGVYLDTERQEIVVANMGNHSATVYPRTASGDYSPLRTIRAAPAGRQALDIGNPGAVSYDTKRDQILVPN
jgi:DNA-binding beta-propeller fold protein YncE